MSWRRLGVLIKHLPPESETRTALRDELTDEQYVQLLEAAKDGHGKWSKNDLLLAAIFDAVERLTFVQLKRGGVKDAKPPAPLPRPGVARSNVTPINPEARAYLQRIREGHGGVVSSQ